MSFSSWLSALKHRSLQRGNARLRRGMRRLPFTSQFILLEDRCLLSAFVPALPSQGTEQNVGLNAVVYTPEGDPSFNQANLPAAKLVTIMNTSSNVVFPIFYGANSTADGTAGQVVRITLTNPGTSYNSTNNPSLWPTVVIKDLTTPSASGAAATVKVAGDGTLYGLELTAPGSGYKPGDQLQVTFDDSANGNQGRNGAATAYVSQLNPGDQKALYDPKDTFNITYRGYIGEVDASGNYVLGLQPGHQVTVMVPIAFWDGGRLYLASNGSVPLLSQFDAGYPLQNDAEWLYNTSTDPSVIQSYIVAPTVANEMPLYGADFADPATGIANPNGVVMWYRDASAPHDFGFGVPAVLTEMTFRDPKQPFIAPDMPPSEVDTIINYDVSYVDSLAMPASMEGTQVPTIPATPGSGQFAWLGSDMSTTQMQQAIATFTTNDLSGGGETPGGANGLGTYFGGLGYDQYYMPASNSPSGAITGIDNPNGGAVTITTGGTAGLQNGMSVAISGIAGQTALNNTWVISNLTNTTFVLTNATGDGTTSSSGTFTAQTTGVAVQKLPAGFQVIADSENQNVASSFDPTQYNLVSGGTKANIATIGTGTATAGSTDILNVSNAIAATLVPGMLWSPVNPPASNMPYFPNGTTIASISVGTGAGNTSTITMSAKANFTGSPGGTNNGTGPGGSWTFNGSQYSTVNSSPLLWGSIAANGNQITGLDPAVGIYLRPGMLVTGAGIPAGTFIAPNGVSADFKTITLTQSIGATPSSGPYTFLGAPDSYVVQQLINVWYSWADYYVAQLASGPNAAPTGTFSATTTANGGRTDYNSLILKINGPATGPGSFDMTQLRVGDVVTGTSTLTANTSGDPSLNYTIVGIDQTARTVELSLPVAVMGAVSDTFTFAAPQYTVRSSDAPAAPGTAGTIPYTLNFTSGGAAALKFAQTVYDVMQSFSLLLDPGTLLSRSALLLRYSIGGNVGSFVTNNAFAGQTGRQTILPHERTHVQLRDEIKSILRGVYSFTAVPDQSQWYPDPATPTPGATLNQGTGAQPVTFGIYNLSPYVWFVHVVLHNSSYGFSLDDDVANTTAKSNSIEIAVGGNAYTAPVDTTKSPPDPPAPSLLNPEAFTPGATYGTQHGQGFIDVTSSYAITNAQNGMTTISGLSQSVVARLLASTNPSDPPGALITSDSAGLLPAGVRVALAQVNPPVGGVDNQSWVTFVTPASWTAPTDQTQHGFTFSSFTTTVPSNVTPPSPAQAPPGTVITITGKGFTGVYGVSFNGIPGTLIGGAVTSVGNVGSPITINTGSTQGLANGDTVTISGVTDQTTGLPAAINRQWVVENVVLNTSFQLMGSTGNGDTLSGGSWIDGTDSAIKVIVPSVRPNSNGTTYPGPTGKIGVRNPSGTSYSSTYFTIASSGGATFSGIDTSTGSLNTVVTLMGTGFTGTSAVTFNGGGGIPINAFTVNANGTQLQITIPVGATGTGTFTITVGGNTFTSTGITFAVNQPVIAASTPFNPSSGPVGTRVTITGTGFTGADDPTTGGVTINGTAALDVQVVNDGTITVVVTPGTASGPVVITTSAGSGSSGANNFTVSSDLTPNITSATPSNAAVGALIQLLGTGFIGVDQAGGGITFNGTAATSFTVVNNTTINVYVPLGATTGPIVVHNSTNPSNSVAFTVGLAGAPVIGQFTPGSGAVNTPVTLTGSGFTNVTDVEFNGTQAFFNIVNDGTITAYVPNGATTGPITATNGLGTGTSETHFVVGTQPTITSFGPDHGPARTVVTLTGTGFTNVIQVNFNGTPASTFKVVSATSITATVPVGATTGPITVSTSGGNAASSQTNFTVATIVFPTITSFTPTVAPVGTQVNLIGSGFTGTTQVTYNGVNASFIVLNDNLLATVVPNGATTGTIAVINPAGAAFSQTNFIVGNGTPIFTSANSATFPVFSLTGTFISPTTVTVPSTSQLLNGMLVTGPGIAPNTTITFLANSTTVTLSTAATPGTGTGIFVFGGNTAFTVAATGAASLKTAGTLPAGLTFTDNGNGTATIGGLPAFTTGSFTFDIIATNSNNLSTTQVFTATVSAPPRLTVTTGKPPVVASTANYTVGLTTNPVIQVTTAAPGGTTLATTVTVTGLPKGVVFTPGTNGGTISGTPTAAAGGIYPLTITARNATDSTVKSFTLTVNQPAPDFVTAAAATFTVGKPVNFIVRATGFQTLPTVATTATIPGLTLTPVPNASTTGSSTVGSNTLTVASTSGLALGMAVTGPGIANGTTVTGLAGTTVTLSANANTLAGAGTFNFGGILTIMGIPTAAAVSRSFGITATIGTKHVTQTFVLTIAKPALAFTSAAKTAFIQGQAGTFTVTTTVPGATLTIPAAANTALAAAGLSFAASPGSAIISGTPNSGTSLTFAITARSGASMVTETFTLAVVKYTTPSGTVATFTAGKAGIATIPGTFPAGTVFTATNGKLPAGLTLTRSATGITVSGTPPAGSGGSYSFQILSDNSPSARSPVYTIIVNQAQPVITSAVKATFTVGQTSSFTVTTTGFPFAAIEFEVLSGFPKGLVFVDNGNGTATLSGTPEAGTGGTYKLVWRADNGLGIATQNFTLTVDAPPVITSPSSNTFTLNTLNSFLITATGLPIPTLKETGTLPPGVVFKVQGNGLAVLQGTPTRSGTFTFFITATSGTQVAVQEFILTVM
jgi:hypothetical protein